MIAFDGKQSSRATRPAIAFLARPPRGGLSV